MKRYYILGNPFQFGMGFRCDAVLSHRSQIEVIESVPGVERTFMPIEDRLSMVDVWISPLYDADEVWFAVVDALDKHTVIVQAELALENVEI